MNETVVEVLKILGYPIGSVVFLVVLAYIGRQLFQKILESLVAKDLELLKNQNAANLEEIKREHNLILEDRKAELSRETERLKSALSVEAETHRLAAHKRFEALLDLWQSSESLIQATDFSSPASIQQSLSQVDEALSHLRKCSILLSPDLLNHVNEYLQKTAKVLTTSEEELSMKKKDPEKDKRIEQLVASIFPAATSLLMGSVFPGVSSVALAGGLSGLIVPSIKKTLENIRYKYAERARVKLQEAIRIEFGVERKELTPLLKTKTENRMS